jgi:hypothetical protein
MLSMVFALRKKAGAMRNLFLLFAGNMELNAG